MTVMSLPLWTDGLRCMGNTKTNVYHAPSPYIEVISKSCLFGKLIIQYILYMEAGLQDFFPIWYRDYRTYP